MNAQSKYFIRKYKRLYFEIISILLMSSCVGMIYNFISLDGVWGINSELGTEFMEKGEISIMAAYQEWESNAIFIDVRSNFNYSEGHIKGAILIPFFSFEDEIKFHLEMLKNKPKVIVYCSGTQCKSSEVIYKKLGEYGLKNVFYFKEGFQEWQNRGYPIE